MAKRFTDTDKWRKQFIRGLQGAYKLLWLYILDECDHAGIWHIEMDIAELRIGNKLNIDEARKQFKGHIVEFNNKWFIPDFIEFQYGTLNPENRAHNSVIERLRKYNLYSKNKLLKSPLQGVKDKDKEKDKDMVKEKDKEGFDEFWGLYPRKINKKDSEQKWIKLKDEERIKIIETLPAWLKQFSDPQFIPHPTTYINQRRWEDEIQQPKAISKLSREDQMKLYGHPL